MSPVIVRYIYHRLYILSPHFHVKACDELDMSSWRPHSSKRSRCCLYVHTVYLCVHITVLVCAHITPWRVHFVLDKHDVCLKTPYTVYVFFVFFYGYGNSSGRNRSRWSVERQIFFFFLAWVWISRDSTSCFWLHLLSHRNTQPHGICQIWHFGVFCLIFQSTLSKST